MYTLPLLSTMIMTLASLALAQAPIGIELKDGDVVIGNVLDVTEREVLVNVEFPESETRTLSRNLIRPRSLFSILASRIDSGSAADLQKLAETAASLGLHQHAIAALRSAARLDEEGQPSYNRAIQSLRESVGERVLESARENLTLGNYASARLEAQFVRESFHETKAYDGVLRLLEKLDRIQAGVPDAKLIDEKSVRKLLEATEERLRQARDRSLFASVNTVSLDSQHRERLEQAVMFLGAVWTPLSHVLPQYEISTELRDLYIEKRTAVRDLLVDHYLALGRIQVQLGALPEATQLNEKACQLDSENDACAKLQRMIVMARIERGALR